MALFAPLAVVVAVSATVASYPASLGPEHPVSWYTPASPPATWPLAKLPVAFTLALPDPRDLKGEALAELDVALRSWGHVGCTAWRGVVAGRAVVTGGNDGVNAIIWHDDVWPADLVPGAAAQTVVYTDATGNVVDTDIHLNGVDFKWSIDGASGTNDARSILTHELGHALGLGHSSDSRATMYAGYPGGISWRSLEQDDKDGVCALYPGTGESGCDVGAACPSGFVCVAGTCERTGAQGEVCSPCTRTTDACAGAGDDARCIDLGSGEAAGRVCGRACVLDKDCASGFHCAPTSTSGDLQCTSNDGCASGPDRCAVDGDCTVGVCRSGACVGKIAVSLDAGTDAQRDAGMMTSLGSHGGCAVAQATTKDTRVDSGRPTIYVGLMLLAFLRRRSRGQRFAPLLLPLLGAVSLLGCSKWTEPAVVPLAEVGDGGTLDCRSVVARVDSLGFRRSVAPPSRAVAKTLPADGVAATYLFDVTVRNPTSGPRWIILPGAFAFDGKENPAPGIDGVMTLRADVLSGRGRVVAVRAGGPGAFLAVLLPGRSSTRLRNVAIESWWTTTHATAKLEAILARDFTIDGEPIKTWLTGEPLSEADGEVSLSDDARNELPAKALAPDTHHPVTFDEECRGTGQAILKKNEL